MSAIRILPPNIVNQIAAGEVVERPASVVKELVENAIDAGATRVEARLEAGGKRLIAVRDNGVGMDRDALSLAVERHATSKLPGDDVFDIRFLGFRGEALPSIGSISRLRIASRKQGASDAWQIEVEGGQKGAPSPAALSQGTHVEVQDLFYATPARLKFMKSDLSENRAVTEMVERLAMAHPAVAFTLTLDGKAKMRLEGELDASSPLYNRRPESDPERSEGEDEGPHEARDPSPFASLKAQDDARLPRLARILGREFSANAMPIDTGREGITLTGFAGLPTYNRGTSALQYLFVNNRPVRDKLLLGTIRAAYQDFLARDRHPVVALFLDVPPEDVDVNVHPAKAEVRFRDNQMIRGLIIGSLRSALEAAGFRASSTVAAQALGAFRPAAAAPYGAPSSASMFQSSGLPPSARYVASAGPAYVRSVFAEAGDYAAYETSSAMPGKANDESGDNVGAYPLGAACAQLHETYIVAQTADGIVIVDQHAAHERLVYERMKALMETTGVRRQALLIPEVVLLNEDSAARLLARSEELLALGLAIESFGDGTVVVREIPALLGDTDVSGLIRDLADDLAEFGETLSLKEKLESICGTMACHSSVRSGRLLSADEMNALLRQMEATPHSGQCNHGRPTYVELKLSDIERLFGRR